MANSTKKTATKAHQIDAAGQSVGRVATRVAHILLGKHSASYEPRLDNRDEVVVVNAKKLKFTGRKLAQKDIRSHSMHPGGLKRTPVKHIFSENAGEVVRHAVRGMLRKNRRRDTLMQRLKVEE